MRSCVVVAADIAPPLFPPGRIKYFAADDSSAEEGVFWLNAMSEIPNRKTATTNLCGLNMLIMPIYTSSKEA
jgi:hypothetical protein